MYYVNDSIKTKSKKVHALWFYQGDNDHPFHSDNNDNIFRYIGYSHFIPLMKKKKKPL
jgi:hypothetical protein